MGLAHNAERRAYLTEILERLARCVYHGEARGDETRSWKEDCHADDSVQSNISRKYDR